MRLRVHLERVLVELDQVVGLLRDDRLEDHVARIGGHRGHAAPPCKLGQRDLRDEQAARPEQLDDRDVLGPGDDHALEVAERERRGRLLLAHEHDERQLLAPGLSTSARASLVFGDENAAPSNTPRLSSAACCESAIELGAPRRLAIHLDAVVAGVRAEDDAAALPQRRAGRARARAAGALLAPRLGGAAGHLAARLGLGRALAAREHLGARPPRTAAAGASRGRRPRPRARPCPCRPRRVR